MKVEILKHVAYGGKAVAPAKPGKPPVILDGVRDDVAENWIRNGSARAVTPPAVTPPAVPPVTPPTPNPGAKPDGADGDGQGDTKTNADGDPKNPKKTGK